jgi:hypothetical protein
MKLQENKGRFKIFYDPLESFRGFRRLLVALGISRRL